MMTIKNPTDKNVRVVIQGTEYAVPANGEKKGVRDDHALLWKEIHGFLSLTTDVGVKTAEVVISVVEEKIVPELAEAVAIKLPTKKIKK